MAAHRSHTAVKSAPDSGVAGGHATATASASETVAAGKTDVINPTRWSLVLLLFAAGCGVSLNMGKVPAALPVLSLDLNLSLFQAGLVVSLFSLLTALIGLLVGLSAARMGYRRAALCGMLLAAVAGLSAPLIQSFSVLLVLRATEGLGWVMVAVSMPVLMTTAAAAHDRPMVLGIWGAFVPVGMMVALLYAPLVIDLAGWRGLWFFTGILCLLGAWVIWRLSASLPLPAASRLASRDIRGVVFRRTTLSMAACFLIYSALYVAVTSFIPLVLIDRHGVSVASAAVLGALIIMGNIGGNVSAGWLIRRGVNPYLLVYLAMFSCGLFAFGIFPAQIPIEWRVVCAMVFVFFGGMIPGTLFASVPSVVAQAAHVGIVNGLIIQGAGNGQFFGPLLQSAIVERGGDWSWALLATTLFSAIGLVSAFVFQKNGPEFSRH